MSMVRIKCSCNKCSCNNFKQAFYFNKYTAMRLTNGNNIS